MSPPVNKSLEEPSIMVEQQLSENDFKIQRIYIKDISFETPNSPLIFHQEWRPEFKLDLQTLSNQLQAAVYEVVLQVTITATLGDTIAFLCQVQQAGVFGIIGFSEDALAPCLGAYCPSILFPYARECISSLVARGSFPQLDLAPVNFEALFADYLQQLSQKSQNAPVLGS